MSYRGVLWRTNKPDDSSELLCYSVLGEVPIRAGAYGSRPFFLPLFTNVGEGEFSEVCIAPVQRLRAYLAEISLLRVLSRLPLTSS